MPRGGKRAGSGRPRTTQSDARAFLRERFEDDEKAGLRLLWSAAESLAEGVQAIRRTPSGEEVIYSTVPDPTHLNRLFEAAYGRAPQTTDLTVSGAVRLVAVKTGFSGPIVPDEPDADRAAD